MTLRMKARLTVATALTVLLISGTAFAETSLSFLVDNNADSVAAAEALAAAYSKKNPEVTVEVEAAPGRRRRRQHRQDPACDRRDDRRLPL